MQTIITKYHGPTNTKGARLKAAATGGIKRFYPYKHELSAMENHARAARALMDQLGWPNRLATGALKDGSHVWVLLERIDPMTMARDVLVRAERFIAGFEGDELMEGMEELLADLRHVIEVNKP